MLKWHVVFRIIEARLFINDTWFNEVWIDTHYEKKHSESINDKLILDLLLLLNYESYIPQVVREDGYQFYETDLAKEGKPYRLIWVIPPDTSYIGVRNAYRRPK